MSETLQSMTGYAAASHSADGVNVSCELRSVNGKGLDIRLRLPSGLESLEIPVRKLCGEKLARGNVQCSVSVESDAPLAPLRIDEAAFSALARQARQLSVEHGLSMPTTDGLLSLRGIVVSDDGDVVSAQGPDSAIGAAVLAAVGEGVERLVAMREAEGAALATLLHGQLDALSALRDDALADPASQPVAIRDRLATQVAALFDADGKQKLDEERIHAEAAILATKADVREETDRLAAHIEAARLLLAGGGAVGRKLDFLAQEFNREVNTLCSKSASVTLTAIGLDMKAVVDQFREQVQNLQ